MACCRNGTNAGPPKRYAPPEQVAARLAFGGKRTYHRLAYAIEDAGWTIRDCLVWAYAQGFSKSKALLKPAWKPIVMARKRGRCGSWRLTRVGSASRRTLILR